VLGRADHRPPLPTSIGEIDIGPNNDANKEAE